MSELVGRIRRKAEQAGVQGCIACERILEDGVLCGSCEKGLRELDELLGHPRWSEAEIDDGG